MSCLWVQRRIQEFLKSCTIKSRKKLDGGRGRWKRGSGILVFSRVDVVLDIITVVVVVVYFLIVYFTTFYMDVIELFTSWKKKLYNSWTGLKGINFRGGYRIPRRRGRQPLGGHQHTNLSDFPKNCTKLRKFWSIGERAPGAPPLDPPLNLSLVDIQTSVHNTFVTLKCCWKLHFNCELNFLCHN